MVCTRRIDRQVVNQHGPVGIQIQNNLPSNPARPHFGIYMANEDWHFLDVLYQNVVFSNFLGVVNES